MPNTCAAIRKQDGGRWRGRIEEIPGINCQEHTRESLLASLRATLLEAVEFNRQDALQAAAA
ncbi:type II toxin-antitoxin system HicB family antitoxin [Candidatus Electronema sp. TJ]|uniref:type II toxin-antitoxin system HicB family antitoxin n=1 Tax=Candidatus Electronema sp. TJ TaxID=3401573 RepID=UPI003AA9D60A